MSYVWSEELISAIKRTEEWEENFSTKRFDLRLPYLISYRLLMYNENKIMRICVILTLWAHNTCSGDTLGVTPFISALSVNHPSYATDLYVHYLKLIIFNTVIYP